MTRRLALSVVIAGFTWVLLVGCADAQNVDPDLTVDDAKASVLAEGQRLVSGIPQKYVDSYDQRETAHLLSCSSGSYTWPDRGEVTLKGDPDASALLVEIAGSYRSRPGFTVEVDKRNAGDHMVIISGENGANYFVSAGAIDTLNVVSFSACFTLEEHQRVGDAY